MKAGIEMPVDSIVFTTLSCQSCHQYGERFLHNNVGEKKIVPQNATSIAAPKAGMGATGYSNYGLRV
jgi:hypothetical protein